MTGVRTVPRAADYAPPAASPAAPARQAARGFGHWRTDPWTRALALVALLAMALRLWHLTRWSFSADEGWTLVETTVNFSWAMQRPLGLAPQHYLLIPWLGLNELSLRLLPALSGIIAVPVLGWCTARVFGRERGTFAALAAAVSPGLIYHSQFARYYMQSFLCATILLFALHAWLVGRSRRAAWIAAAAAVAGWFIVPTTMLVIPGIGLWAIANLDVAAPPRLAAWIRRRALLLGGGIALLGAALYPVAIWVGRETMQEGEGRYYSLPHLAMSVVASITLVVSLLAVAGIVLAWVDRARPFAERSFLPLVAAGCVLPLLAVFPVAYVSPWHVVSVLPVAFIAVGCALGALWSWAPSPLAGASLVTVLLGATAPDLASYYAQGNRYDYRGAVQALRPRWRAEPGRVFTVGRVLVNHYAPELRAEEFVPSNTPFAWMDDPARTATAWLIVPEGRRGLAYPEELAGVRQMRARCTVVDRIGRPRVDFFDHYMLLLRCPAPGAAR